MAAPRKSISIWAGRCFAFLDHNKIVGVVRDDEWLQRNVGTLKDEAVGGGTRKAGVVFNEGDVVGPKIARIKLYPKPDETSTIVATMTRRDEFLVSGEEANNFIKVEGAAAVAEGREPEKRRSGETVAARSRTGPNPGSRPALTSAHTKRCR
jgi:hypothetical protein